MAKTAMTGATKTTSSEASSEAATSSQPIPQPFYSINDTNNSLQITQTKLNGSNFVEWSQSALLVIDDKGRLEHLTGQTEAPAEGTPEFKEMEVRKFYGEGLAHKLYGAKDWKKLNLLQDGEGNGIWWLRHIQMLVILIRF